MKKLFFLLIFILIFAFVSFAQNRAYERTDLWQKEIDAFIEIDKKQTPPENAILFIGSSSFRKWENLRKDFPKSNVINRGFGGSHIEDVNHFFGQIVTPYKPKIVVFYAGENDITAGKSPETVLEDFRLFWRKFRQDFPKTKFIFVSLKPSPSRWNLRDKFQQTNILISNELKSDRHALFLSVWNAMLNEKSEPRAELFIEDKLHMNEKGYEIWRGLLEKHLK